MAVTQTAQACDLVIFGAKGDLARRKLLPSLYQLEKAGQLNPDTRIIGVGGANCDKRLIPKLSARRSKLPRKKPLMKVYGTP
ncbi:hypothetical protein ACLK1Z_10915 [Escherichia coli]